MTSLDTFFKDHATMQPTAVSTDMLIEARRRGDFYLDHCTKCLKRIFPNGVVFDKRYAKKNGSLTCPL